jgi:hypothetical protein
MRSGMSEVQTVEVNFHGEKLATATIEGGIYTLYRVAAGRYYVYMDHGEGHRWLASRWKGEEIGDFIVRALWPELLEAAELV